MKALVIYESMFGNTHHVAESIGHGIESDPGFGGSVAVMPLDAVTVEDVTAADLVVVGGPTHAHGMSHESTRSSAVEIAHKPDAEVELDPDAPGPGLREWFDSLGEVHTAAAAFDTRFEMAAVLTGRASKGINRRLRHHGFAVIDDPQSFFVTKQNELEDGELARALEWGAQLGALLVTSRDQTSPADVGA